MLHSEIKWQYEVSWWITFVWNWEKVRLFASIGYLNLALSNEKRIFFPICSLKIKKQRIELASISTHTQTITDLLNTLKKRYHSNWRMGTMVTGVCFFLGMSLLCVNCEEITVIITAQNNITHDGREFIFLTTAATSSGQNTFDILNSTARVNPTFSWVFQTANQNSLWETVF